MIKCPNCGFEDSGYYCSRCGSKLTPIDKTGILSFAAELFNIRTLRDYIKTYFLILSSPTKSTWYLFEDSNYNSHHTFLITSIGFHVLFSLSSSVVVKEHPVVANLFITLSFFVVIVVSIMVTYLLCKRKSTIERSSGEFLRLTSLCLGFNTPIFTLCQVLQSIHGMVGRNIIMVVSLPLIAYIVRVVRKFWSLSAGRVFFYWLLGSFVGTLVGVVLFWCGSLFLDIQFFDTLSR
jgi:hypothetical protein